MEHFNVEYFTSVLFSEVIDDHYTYIVHTFTVWYMHKNKKSVAYEENINVRSVNWSMTSHY